MKNLLSKEVITKIIYVILGIILLVSPIIVLPGFLYSFVVVKVFFFMLLTEIVTIFYLLLIFLYPEYRPKKNIILYSFLFFILVNIISGILSVDPSFSFWSSSYRADGVILLTHVFLFFLIIAFTVKSKKVINFLIASSVFSALIISVSIYLSPSGFGIIHQIFNQKILGGLLGNDSFAGVYLLFNLYLIIYLFFEIKSRFFRYLFEIIFVIILFSPIFFNFNIFRGLISINNIITDPMLLVGSSRGSAISFIVGVLTIILLFFTKNALKKVRISFRFLSGAFFTILSFLIILLIIPGNNLNKWFGEKTGGYRFIYWNQAIDGFKERPILGWGPGSFKLINTKYYNPIVVNKDIVRGEIVSDKAHGIIFDTLCCTGVLGLLSYLSIFISLFIVLWRSLNIKYHTKVIFTGLFISYFLQNLIFFDVLVSFLMFAFSAGIIIALDNNPNHFYKVSELNDKFVKRIYIVLFIFLILLGGTSIYYIIFLPLKESRENDKFFKLNMEERGPLYINNRNFSSFGGSSDVEYYAYIIYQQYLMSFNQIKEAKNHLPYINDLDGIISEVSKLSKNNEESFLGAHLIFQLYDIKYQLSENDLLTLNKMKKYSEKEILLSPKNPLGYIDNARVFFYYKQYLESLVFLEKAFELCPNNMQINQLIIFVSKKIGNKNLIEERIQRAEKNIPGVNFRQNLKY